MSDKIAILKKYRVGAESEKYSSIDSMVEFESGDYTNKIGSRTLLRLHRALDFIVRFLEGIPKLSAIGPMTPLSPAECITPEDSLCGDSLQHSDRLVSEL